MLKYALWTGAVGAHLVANFHQTRRKSICLNIEDAINEEYYVVMLEDVGEVLETMQIEKEPPMDGKIEPIETFAESENATNFKDFEALHVIVLDIDDQ